MVSASAFYNEMISCLFIFLFQYFSIEFLRINVIITRLLF